MSSNILLDSSSNPLPAAIAAQIPIAIPITARVLSTEPKIIISFFKPSISATVNSELFCCAALAAARFSKKLCESLSVMGAGGFSTTGGASTSLTGVGFAISTGMSGTSANSSVADNSDSKSSSKESVGSSTRESNSEKASGSSTGNSGSGLDSTIDSISASSKRASILSKSLGSIESSALAMLHL